MSASDQGPQYDESTVRAILAWHLDAGCDETIGETPVDRFAAATSAVPAPPAAAARSPLPQAVPATARPVPRGYPANPVESAVALAGHATSLDELKNILAGFDGCPLRRTATQLVFGDGNPLARVILVGEAPGAEEDRQGLPFVGPSGRLLDRMLASIGLDRKKVFITNTVFWRPPGNRSPTSGEIATCLPFLERIVEVIDPELLIALGGPAATALFGQADSVGRLRGRWFTYQTPRISRPVPATALFHPAYLLRSPGQKQLAWRDLLAIKSRLKPPQIG